MNRKANDISHQATKKRGLVFCTLCIICLLSISGCAHKRVAYQPLQEPLRNHSKSKRLYQIGSVRLPDSVRFDSRLASFYHKWEKVPYRLGGASRKGVDCSALIQIAYNELYHKQLPRTVREQAQVGKKISPKQLRKGDLVFFKTGWRGRHVGMFVGGNSFLHVSEQIGVTISELMPTPENKGSAAAYWSRKFWCARRLPSL